MFREVACCFAPWKESFCFRETALGERNICIWSNLWAVRHGSSHDGQQKVFHQRGEQYLEKMKKVYLTCLFRDLKVPDSSFVLYHRAVFNVVCVQKLASKGEFTHSTPRRLVGDVNMVEKMTERFMKWTQTRGAHEPCKNTKSHKEKARHPKKRQTKRVLKHIKATTMACKAAVYLCLCLHIQPACSGLTPPGRLGLMTCWERDRDKGGVEDGGKHS